MNERTLGYRLFRFGSLPARRRVEYEREGVVLVAEGVRITITYRNYRAPGKRFVWRRTAGSGSAVLTRKRLVVYSYRWPILNVELDDPQFGLLAILSPAPNTLQIEFEAGTFDPKRSGSVAIEIRSSLASALRSALPRTV
jgi:hypothetical protein